MVYTSGTFQGNLSFDLLKIKKFTSIQYANCGSRLQCFVLSANQEFESFRYILFLSMHEVARNFLDFVSVLPELVYPFVRVEL